MSALTQSSVWQALYKHYLCLKNVKMCDLSKADPHRFDKFLLRFNDIPLDYSKNRITEETTGLLLDLTRHADLAGTKEAMSTGQKKNITEKRDVLHVVLKNRSSRPIYVDGKDVMPGVNKGLTGIISR